MPDEDIANAIAEAKTEIAGEEADSGDGAAGSEAGDSGSAPEASAHEGGSEDSADDSKPEAAEAKAGETEKAESSSSDGEADEDPFKLSAEDLKAINDDERLARAYKSMQRGLTKNRQADKAEVEALRKEAEIGRFVQEHPEEALAIIAKQRGVQIPNAKEQKEEKQAVSDTVDEIMDMTEKRVGKEAAQVLAPLVKDIAKMVAENVVRQQIDPIKNSVQSQEHQARVHKARAALDAFGSRIQSEGGEWNEEIVSEMNNQALMITPTEDVDHDTFLEIVYDRAMSIRNRAASKREQLQRLRAAKSSSEPVSNMRPTKDKPMEITDDMDEREAIKLAVAQATREATA